jgi:hypothetical protein
MRQEDSGAALQRIRRLLVQVRDGTRVFEDFLTHDKFWIGRRCRLDSEDMGTASGELPAGCTREMEVQERANCLDVVPLPRAIGLIPTNCHGDALRFRPHRARAAFRAAALRPLGDGVMSGQPNVSSVTIHRAVRSSLRPLAVALAPGTRPVFDSPGGTQRLRSPIRSQRPTGSQVTITPVMENWNGFGGPEDGEGVGGEMLTFFERICRVGCSPHARARPRPGFRQRIVNSGMPPRPAKIAAGPEGKCPPGRSNDRAAAPPGHEPIDVGDMARSRPSGARDWQGGPGRARLYAALYSLIE